METLNHAHQISQQYTKEHTDKYIILFGNQEYGWVVTKEELKEYWSIGIRNSKDRSIGDITLVFNGQWIRAGHNLEKKITDKDVQYPCFYRKNNVKVSGVVPNTKYVRVR